MLAFAVEVMNLLPYQMLGVFRPLFMDVLSLSNGDVGKIQAAFGIVSMMMYIPGGYLADRCCRHHLMSHALWIIVGCGMYLCNLPQSITALMFLWMIMAVAFNLLFWSSLVACIRQAGGEFHGGIAFGLEQCARGVIATILSNVMLMLVGSASPAQRQDEFLLLLRVMTILAGMVALYFLLASDASSIYREPEFKVIRFESIEGRSQTCPIMMMAVIIATTYIGNVTTGYFAQFAHDGVGLSIQEAGELATLTFVMRACSPLLAGKAADTWGKSKTAIVLFMGVTGSYMCLALTPISFMSSTTLAIEICCASAFVFGLTSIYFSFLDELNLSQAETGWIVGILSTAGFLPGDVLLGPLAGHMLDAYPGETGFRILMFFAAGCGLIGLLATFIFRLSTGSQNRKHSRSNQT